MRAGWLISMAILAGCATRDECPAGDLSLHAGTPAFAVMRHDATYSSGAIALLAADGTVIDFDFVDSGTRVSTLVTSLSGDAVLPSTSLGLATIAWIGRLNVDVLTLVVDGAPIQIDTRAEAVGGVHTGATTNPQDAIRLDDGRVLVSRLNGNLDPSAPELQRGNDVIVIEGQTVTQRLDLHADGVLDGCTSGRCTAYARPAVLLPLRNGGASVVLVVLERNAGLFTEAGPGAVIAIDARTLAVSAPLEIAPLENCQFASVDPRDASRAYVLCTSLQAGGPDERRPHAGIAEITLTASGTLSLTGVAQSAGDDPVVGTGLIALGDRRVLAIAHDSPANDTSRADHVVEIDVASGSLREVYQSQGGFVLQSGVLSGTTALVPDMESNAILRFDVSGPATLRDRVVFDDCIGLPPVQISPLDF